MPRRRKERTTLKPSYEAEPSNDPVGGIALKVPTKMKDKKMIVDPIM
jgi:hypothetical protein